MVQGSIYRLVRALSRKWDVRWNSCPCRLWGDIKSTTLSRRNFVRFPLLPARRLGAPREKMETQTIAARYVDRARLYTLLARLFQDEFTVEVIPNDAGC